jgi:hypothetical protein
MIPEEEQSRARLLFVKAFALVSILDDTFDVGATIEECHSFNEAMQRYKAIYASHCTVYKVRDIFKLFPGADGMRAQFRLCLNIYACCI